MAAKIVPGYPGGSTLLPMIIQYLCFFLLLYNTISMIILRAYTIGVKERVNTARTHKCTLRSVQSRNDRDRMVQRDSG